MARPSKIEAQINLDLIHRQAAARQRNERIARYKAMVAPIERQYGNAGKGKENENDGQTDSHGEGVQRCDLGMQ